MARTFVFLIDVEISVTIGGKRVKILRVENDLGTTYLSTIFEGKQLNKLETRAL